MEKFAAIGQWLTENESILSGAAAMAALAGILFSAFALIGKRMTKSRLEASTTASAAAEKPMSLKELTAPAPYAIHYAQSDGLRIAYAKMGSGPYNIMVAPGIISHLNITANMPSIRDTFNAVGEFGNVVTFDKRGQGLSDPCVDPPDVVQRVHDIEAVLDAAGLDKVVLFGISEGGPMSVKFAHEHPERVQGLVLLGSTACWLQGANCPGGIEESMLDRLAAVWGTGVLRRVFFPSISQAQMSDEVYKAFERLIATRSSVRQIVEYIKRTDVRDLLPQISCPTLVIHFSGDLAVPVRMGRAMADAIPNAEFVELPGIDHADLSSAPEGLAKVRQFVEMVNATAEA
ncbi:alpha/beta fold hydrolase [Congregibacter sp.]|jgi:pimeloyl-ACP methyl ester carboxylesterase|uniref:alpha/beta fold hydrolase n=1 Tax=Congregibacter sp. TaxID=2744308 RepID=UPI0039E6DCA0